MPGVRVWWWGAEMAWHDGGGARGYRVHGYDGGAQISHGHDGAGDAGMPGMGGRDAVA